MGRDTSSVTYTHAERTRYRITMRENLETFARYLPKAEFAPAGSIGMEMEMNLIDADGRPVRRATDTLAAIGSQDFTTELGAHNLELNLPAFPVKGDNLDRVEQALRARLALAQERAGQIGVRLLPIGILPTLTAEDLRHPHWRNPENRYQALDHAILEARGEDITIQIQGDDETDLVFSSIAPESACTSVQLHLQVTPSNFAPTWNAAQAIAGPQVALSANSPFFLGNAGWAESRIPVFSQAADTRPPEFITQGVRPRVWFGERWINTVFDLWEENVRYFPAILPESRQAAGTSLLTEGAAPRLHELVLHNGTVWRWNRPIYDAGGGGRPNLRVENRVLAAGPTIADQMADAAFFYGLVSRLARQVRPIWSRMPFADAEANFTACAQHGLDAEVRWPGLGRVPVAELLADVLIPLAATGLEMLEVDPGLISHYMSVVRERAISGHNGAAWQRHVVSQLESGGLSRAEALVRMTCLYRDEQHIGEPVHTWSVS
ncbi:glutamate-cysteine ligase family protein [Acidipropionibacterium jensenii]|uniref:glutamate-cysteine ligase family protein n=1 Tax=Acidipropionibacterium jensenii TaxID=1749 RepID=UPI00264748DB|nr:glutamate-cysteine ligase family protein [Acidipropionibacterium jensenii]MDN5977671.1 glutamate-cysteine ligase family protein [Acidipropionibacterium jensenii]MDN5996654.1 glutamate-cysteine ligase family protein [Acidipropionibacterium jensenii]MDN6427156.1 glutamate-cysteine ligase family protein [Acidipropionibacterium jensenii]MDN6440883.1 glutamate-cysteine ligase family protein [Acidipropionibacterium jensenii]MDN6480616.1 glutamate-cysteine ligase family protein [Acidipropionibacte